MDFSNRNILMISPEFFGLEKNIINFIKDKGGNAYWYDERPNLSSFGRAVNSIFPKIFKRKSNKYFKSIVEEMKDVNIDTVLVVKGEQVSEKTIALFRETFKNAKLILYLWDPISCCKEVLNVYKLFDRVLSFDSEDCRKYGFEFRPLFTDLENLGDQNYSSQSKYLYDLCFFGTLYGDRCKVLSNIESFCKDNGIKYYGYYFLRGKFMYLYYYLRSRSFRKLSKSNIHYVPLPTKEVQSTIDSSKAILDINEIKQSGLTMRTIETVCRGKKLVTTNHFIKGYDLYNENNICVFDRKENIFDKTFLDNNYTKLDESIIDKYSPKGWTKDVLK